MLSKTQIKQVKRDLEDKGITLAAIARECNVHPSLPGNILRGLGVSARVRSKIVERLGYDPWKQEERRNP